MPQLSALRTVIPRQLEITRQFQVQDLSDSELRGIKDRFYASDLEADLKNILGRFIDQCDFIEVTWEKFQQFVQRISEPVDRLNPAQLSAPIEKADITTQLRLSAK